jgi:carbon monoxide dehydrogenase subunit G
MRITQSFSIARPPEVVFDYVVDPANLAAWQTSKTRVEPITEGAPRAGYRVREWTKPPGAKEFEQVVELSEFERPRRLGTHIVEGPQPIDGTWTFEPDGAGTRVEFVAEGELRGFLRLIGPVARRVIDRQFAGYHANLRRNVEALG